jgi:hypothetical protein
MTNIAKKARFARRGWWLVVVLRDAEGMQSFRMELVQFGGGRERTEDIHFTGG